MTRIIAGSAGSLPLEVPSAGTRPTSDRVRESLFGALESSGALAGASVLDLYAGSGALGLEAASRGAATVDLVERSPAAAAVVRRNASKVGRALGGTAAVRVHGTSVLAFLRSASGVYDLVFLDPPYDLGDAELTAALDALLPRLSRNATVIVERASRSPRPELPDGLHAVRDKRYGDTTLWWLQPVSESQSR